MTDDRKQEQQRKTVEQMELARKIMVKDRNILAQLAESERADEEKLKDALCGPYGRFFNEGTD